MKYHEVFSEAVKLTDHSNNSKMLCLCIPYLHACTLSGAHCPHNIYIDYEDDQSSPYALPQTFSCFFVGTLAVMVPTTPVAIAAPTNSAAATPIA